MNFSPRLGQFTDQGTLTSQHIETSSMSSVCTASIGRLLELVASPYSASCSLHYYTITQKYYSVMYPSSQHVWSIPPCHMKLKGIATRETAEICLSRSFSAHVA